MCSLNYILGHNSNDVSCIFQAQLKATLYFFLRFRALQFHLSFVIGFGIIEWLGNLEVSIRCVSWIATFFIMDLMIF